LIKRVVVVVTVWAIAVAWALTSVVHPAVSASAAVPTAAPIRHHKTARLCSAAVKIGHATCFAIRQTDTVQPAGVSPSAVTPQVAPAGYGPSTLAAAYKLDASKGSGQTVAIVDAYDDPNAESDLAAYRTQYALSDCTTANGCFSKVSQSGSTVSLPPADAGWAGEISLDLDMVSAACPNCHILLVEATSNSLLDLGTAVNEAVLSGAKYVSNSYGGSEFSGVASFDSTYYHHAGVAITASTGDFTYQAGPQFPATGADVTAVGGTSLITAGNARGWTETAWNDHAGDGTGSGCSASIAKPAFQVSLNTGCANRAEADVAAVSDPNTGMAVYDTYGFPGWQVVGGTSAASPIIASVYALAGTPGASDSPNAYPYAHASNLFDVTGGNNGTCAPAVLCTAGAGWDGPTGLGTPNGTGAFALTVPGAPTGVTATAGNGRAVVSWRAPASNGGSPITGYTVSATAGGASATTAGALSATVPGLINGNTYTFTVTAANAAGPSLASAASNAVTARAPWFTGRTPVRVLDTRTTVGGHHGTLGARATLTLAVPGLPVGATAVALNVTVTNPSTAGNVTVYPGGAPLPLASNLNYLAGQTIPNMVMVPLGPGNTVTFYNSAGTVNVIADLLGSYAPGTGGGFTGGTPVRVLDTRSTVGGHHGTLGAGATLTLAVPGLPVGATAVALNVTVTDPSAASTLTVYPGGAPLPLASNLNYLAGQTIPNMVMVPLGPGNTVTFYNSAGTVNVIADLLGYYAPGTGDAFTGGTPVRVLDTRTTLGAHPGTLGAGATLTLTVPGLPVGATAVALNVTVTGPSAASTLTVYPGGTSLPLASNLNYVAGQTIPNMVLVPLGPGNTVTFYNSAGTVNVIADLAGYFG
jgi:hypothetical protein